ncbi:J domain-containing protein [Paenibacillus oenotherae]|uniref:J domain-containing protein n=1 Tax=Paenibacillus oenotherae TaxID=1435645 RepID=A0ABS7D3Z3_9BACL|nr:J domain-containing protein [Paenibacillus oenotherae]MBW7474586.1 J domain-containing protein [Paenibacillus oenotherae]
MDKLKQAYERMGLPENASKEEVEQRFSILARQARSRKQRQSSSDPESAEDSFAEISSAYRLILGLDDQRTVDQFTEKEYGKYKKFAGAAEKTDHFFHYYKFHLLGGILVIALLIYGIQIYLNYQAEQERLANLPPIDLSVMFIGDFGNQESDELEIAENALLAQFPEWKRTAVMITYLPTLPEGQTDFVLQQKAVITLMTEKPDAFIMDRSAFAWLSSQGVLRNLDAEAAGLFQPHLPPDSAMKAKAAEDTAEHIYGIDLSSSPLAQKLPLKSNNEFIYGLRTGGNNDAKALHFITNYIKPE